MLLQRRSHLGALLLCLLDGQAGAAALLLLLLLRRSCCCWDWQRCCQQQHACVLRVLQERPAVMVEACWRQHLQMACILLLLQPWVKQQKTEKRCCAARTSWAMLQLLRTWACSFHQQPMRCCSR